MSCAGNMERGKQPAEKVFGGGRKRRGESVGDNEGGGDTRGIDRQLWHACAGGMVQLPHSGSKVFYFPQGHAEHAATPFNVPPLRLRSTISCRVISVKFLADMETDEVYARICLQPELEAASDDPTDDLSSSPLPLQKSASFVKTLTQSDANNGGGFSVPRYCAETIFPRLDYSVDPPVQTVLAKDVHGDVWKFRHIYRGTPRRHLLTTGWSTFVNQKKLVAGDAIVFLRTASGELCVGVRRSTRGAGCVDSSPWHLSGAAGATLPAQQHPLPWEVKFRGSYDFLGGGENGASMAALETVARTGSSPVGSPGNFSRNRARVTAKSVLDAATLASEGKPFEVIYYPQANIPEFCVKTYTVKTALQQSWAPGMRFKMAVETEDSSRTSWFMGTISKVQEVDPVIWPASPWKMLQVTWDEPELMQGVSRVNPWQVELVSRMQLPPFSLPKKKSRVVQVQELQVKGQGLAGLTGTSLTNNVLGNLNSWHGFTDSVAAGMQGARHGQAYDCTLQEFQYNTWSSGFLDRLQQHHVQVGSPRVSTDLNIGSLSQPECTNEQNNPLPLTVEASSRNESASGTDMMSWGGSSNTKSTHFLLFGKAINTQESIKAQKPQLSRGSSSNGLGCDCVSEEIQSDVPFREHRLPVGNENGRRDMCNSSLQLHLGKILDHPVSNDNRNLKWFKDQSASLNSDKVDRISDDNSIHCKVFRESDELVDMVDLSHFSSYEEFYGRLTRMFSIDDAEILNRLVYMDSEGLSRYVGEESYRDFVKNARRLKIVSESSSESMT